MFRNSIYNQIPILNGEKVLYWKYIVSLSYDLWYTCIYIKLDLIATWTPLNEDISLFKSEIPEANSAKFKKDYVPKRQAVLLKISLRYCIVKELLILSHTIPTKQGLSQDFIKCLSKRVIHQLSAHPDLASYLLQILIPNTFDSLFYQKKAICIWAMS